MTPKCEVIRRPVPQQKTCASSKWSETLVLNPKPAENHPISIHFQSFPPWNPGESHLRSGLGNLTLTNFGSKLWNAPGPTPETTTSRCLPSRGGSPSHSPKWWSSGGSPRDILQKNHGKIQRCGAFSAEKTIEKRIREHYIYIYDYKTLGFSWWFKRIQKTIPRSSWEHVGQWQKPSMLATIYKSIYVYWSNHLFLCLLDLPITTHICVKLHKSS